MTYLYYSHIYSRLVLVYKCFTTTKRLGSPRHPKPSTRLSPSVRGTLSHCPSIKVSRFDQCPIPDRPTQRELSEANASVPYGIQVHTCSMHAAGLASVSIPRAEEVELTSEAIVFKNRL
jgi:hypothetical protein